MTEVTVTFRVRDVLGTYIPSLLESRTDRLAKLVQLKAPKSIIAKEVALVLEAVELDNPGGLIKALTRPPEGSDDPS